MCRPTRTNSNLQNSTLLEDAGAEQPKPSTDGMSTPTYAEMSPHKSLQTMNVPMYCNIVTVAASAIVLKGVHASIFAEEEFSSQTCIHDLSPILHGNFSGIWRQVIPALFVLLLFLLSRDTAHKICTDLFSSIWKNLKKASCCGSNGTFSSLSRVTSVKTFQNLSKNFLHSLDSCSLRAAIQAITRKECFARSDYIERLSINDVAMLYRYATNVNVASFDKTKFLSEQSQIVRPIMTAMDMAVKVSRGCLKEPKKLEKWERREGDVDALYFVAATRVFAEWRTLRLVPKGYQRYAVSLSLAYRDVLQNLEKIERGVHEYLRHHQDKEPNKSVPSPTIQQLLQFELDMNVHKRLPKLEEKSTASGILWTKRQLHYQVATLSNSLEVPECYPTAKDAASAAYHIVYDDYHGWAVKQIFSHGFGGSPPLDKLWISLDPPKDMPENGKVRRKISKDQPSFQVMPGRTLSDISDESNKARKQSEDNELLLALDNMNRRIVEKWEDMLRMFNCGTEEKKKSANLVLSSDSHFNLIKLDQSSTKSAKNESTLEIMERSELVLDHNRSSIERSKRSTEDFVREVSPLIADLDEMIQKFNMNDPTRV
ncbi:glycolipid transfer protein GLTP [Nitzschia inconspicua]|uniref:Glycolipid transfer protein GLTP n=1 Tax=Nitzschia inconspicua TaxID=303405 RepID=A0A9K3L7G0_9STRA|nr:glycolipid transfer protein GLTP [Nitzschia inconspicua]